ncbi:MAG: ATP-binding cassette domain-containing protein [Anaerolineae bacterium]
MSPAAAAPVVEAVGLTRVYPDAVAVQALDAVDVRIDRGEFVAIMGPSGSGKSTLLHLVGALDRPTAGVIRVDGQDLAAVDDLDRFRARSIGFIFQMHNLLPTLTAAGTSRCRCRASVSRRRRGATGGSSCWTRSAWATWRTGCRTSCRAASASASRWPGAGERPGAHPGRRADGQPGLNVRRRGRRPLQHLAREHGKTIVLVTHDAVVALAAERIITLRDDRIDQDERVDETYVRQLEALRPTPLGRLLFGDRPVADATGLPAPATRIVAGFALREGPGYLARRMRRRMINGDGADRGLEDRPEHSGRHRDPICGINQPPMNAPRIPMMIVSSSPPACRRRRPGRASRRSAPTTTR